MKLQGIHNHKTGPSRATYLKLAWLITTCLLLLAFVVGSAAAGGVTNVKLTSADGLALAANSLHVSTLRVNTFDNPIGLSDTTPILSWQVSGVAGSGPAAMQSAYEIRVATSVPRLKKSPDMWDSGRVESSSSNNIIYEGAPLQPRQALVWSVRVWDGNGQASNWSPPATWEMGLLTNADWSAKWIENPDYTYETDGVPNPLPIFGKAFTVHGTVAKARLYMTGLGQYAAKLNGQPVGPNVLEPGETSFFAEIDYRTYDVTNLLQVGSNVIGVETGSGEYDRVITPGRYFFQNNPEPVYGTPKVIAQLEITYADGSVQTIDTDTSWLTELGPTTYSAWWAGEDYDARRIAANWTSSAANLEGPDWRAAGLVTLTPDTYPQDTTPLVADPRPPVTVQLESHPVSITPVTPPGGDTRLVADANPGDTTVYVASTGNFEIGDTINIDTTGTTETGTVTAVGNANETALAAPAAAGDSNIKVNSTGQRCFPFGCFGTPFINAGDTIVIGSSTDHETAVVASVGSAGATGTGVDLTAPLGADHANGEAVVIPGSGISFTPALTSSHPFGATVTGTKPPTWVLDFGVNQSGLPKITVSGEAGTRVQMIPSEEIYPDGLVNVGSTGASATSRILYHYTLRGGGTETWHSQFTYNGFRYLQVSGLTSPPTRDTITTLVTYNSSRETASFESSSDLLNSIYAITKRALESNMQSVLTDCPDREKGPYTGDNLHNIDTELTLFDMQSFQRQLVNNMRTAQRPVPFDSQFPGMIANIAPEYHFVPPISFGSNWFLDEPNWGGAVIRIPWQLYLVYGDTKTMTQNYEAMVKWLEYEAATKAANGGNIRGLGDWSAAQSTDAQAVIDYGYYRGVSTMAKIAAVLGKTGDAATYSALASSLKDEYNSKYLHTDADGHAWYADNTEASNAVALDAGLVPDQYHQAVVDSLVQAVDGFGNRIGTGSVAIGPLFRQLHAAGRDDVIYQMVTNPASPGYAYLVDTGHTTLAESLSGTGSQNHHFLGEVNSWFVHSLAGIQQMPDSIGYQNLLIKPAVFDNLDSVSGSYTTPAGEVTSSWQHVGKGVSFNFSLPDNVTATVSLPATGTTQSYRASGNGGAVFVGIQDGREIWTVGAGQTHFQPK